MTLPQKQCLLMLCHWQLEALCVPLMVVMRYVKPKLWSMPIPTEVQELPTRTSIKTSVRGFVLPMLTLKSAWVFTGIKPVLLGFWQIFRLWF